MRSDVLKREGRVLLLTLGSTPQVVTETLYALATSEPPWIPDRIILATTDHGAKLFREGRQSADRERIAPLLGEEGKLVALQRLLGLPTSEDCVQLVVPRSDNGLPINDIRTEDETRAFAEELLTIVADITSVQGSELHISLAGGRKTMSFIAGQVMSIFGRKQDLLSHVMIEPRELEWQDSFWWPGDGSPNSCQARIGLYHVPYLRARAWLDPNQIMKVSPGYASAVDMANQSLGHVPVTIDLVQGHLAICGQYIELGAQQLATLALISIAAKRGLEVETVTDWHPADRKSRGLALGGDLDLAHRLWAFLYHCCVLDSIYEGEPVLHFGRLDSAMVATLEKFSVDDRVASPLSRMRKELGEELPPALAERVVAPRGYTTLLDPEDITILGPIDLVTHPDWPVEMICRG